jgi:hypothetical protein
MLVINPIVLEYSSNSRVYLTITIFFPYPRCVIMISSRIYPEAKKVISSVFSKLQYGPRWSIFYLSNLLISYFLRIKLIFLLILFFLLSLLPLNCFKVLTSVNWLIYIMMLLFYLIILINININFYTKSF